jgi:RNA polymerase sigma-70 factor (ECF subfamily)
MPVLRDTLSPPPTSWAGWEHELFAMSQPDAQVEGAIEKVQNGAIDAYSTVVEAYHIRLRNLIAGSSPPGVDADEIAHRAFVQAYRQIQDYRLGTNFYGWLSTIARNLLLAELKRYQRNQKNTSNYLNHLIAHGLVEVVEMEPEFNEERMVALKSCQEQISSESRQLLLARYESQTPLEQVAQGLGKSIAAIKFQLFAIRKKLLKCVRGKLAIGRLKED